MEINPLNAISPIDGRYRKQVDELFPFFSEQALMRYRLQVEVEYFIALVECGLPQLTAAAKLDLDGLRSIYRDFDEAGARIIKEKEAITNHDVKALEYYLKDQLDKRGFTPFLEFVHFGLTSQDVNNTAFPMSIRDAQLQVYQPALDKIIQRLADLSSDWAELPMLSRTHGQPASPTRLGKEIRVFVERLQNQREQLFAIPPSAKFGGATGNFNAHCVAYPEIDWRVFANAFLKNRLGLERQQYTTQIEHYDNLCALFDGMKRINNILIDLNRDVWTYISLDYFKQRIKEGEVGSSAMPHKVNPIDFENSEGNLGMANAVFEHLSAKLPISRLQRDLTDSTVLRNVGVPFAHSLIAFKSLLRGLDKLLVNEAALKADLENNWAVVAEAIQTVLRREGVANPYEQLRDLTRKNERIGKEQLHAFIDQLPVSDNIRKELKAVTPFNYTGV
ncbi:adenylosuccinate lyase [Candidatus Pollutiaquabacter sp.]|uniref:adenylosuccinate lyase n=1 Tax=Candidatus Pollutiaquabacter sp. TaxID=3416354 RepID=UPI003C7FD5E0|nr:adenylosuccinate lyase [Bacteroidota bacterium]